MLPRLPGSTSEPRFKKGLGLSHVVSVFKLLGPMGSHSASRLFSFVSGDYVVIDGDWMEAGTFAGERSMVLGISESNT